MDSDSIFLFSRLIFCLLKCKILHKRKSLFHVSWGVKKKTKHRCSFPEASNRSRSTYVASSTATLYNMAMLIFVLLALLPFHFLQLCMFSSLLSAAESSIILINDHLRKLNYTIFSLICLMVICKRSENVEALPVFKNMVRKNIYPRIQTSVDLTRLIT